MKNNVSDAEISKELNSTRESSVTCSYIWHVSISKFVYWLDTQSVKVWWRYNNSDMNDRQKCMKTPKKRIKTKWRSITCSYIWHVDISKYVYWSNTHSVNVLWRYVLLNANAAPFSDVFFRHRAMFSTSWNKESRKSKVGPR